MLISRIYSYRYATMDPENAAVNLKSPFYNPLVSIMPKPLLLLPSHCSLAMSHYYYRPLLLVASLAAAAAAASLPPPSSLDPISNPNPTLDLIPNPNPTLPAEFNSSAAVHGDIWSWYCTTFERWSLPRLKADDCSGALEWFYIHVMHEGGTKREEFIAPGAKKTTYGTTQWTPRKYTFGTGLSLPFPFLIFPSICYYYLLVSLLPHQSHHIAVQKKKTPCLPTSYV